MGSKPEGDSKVLDLGRQGEALREHLEESRVSELVQMIKDAEQQWGSVLQAARQTEHRALSDDFDAQSEHNQSWIRERQLELQSVGNHTPPEKRCHTAQVCFMLLCTLRFVILSLPCYVVYPSTHFWMELKKCFFSFVKLNNFFPCCF